RCRAPRDRDWGRCRRTAVDGHWRVRRHDHRDVHRHRIRALVLRVRRASQERAGTPSRAARGRAAVKHALRHHGTNANTRARQLAARREQLIAVAEHLFLQHGFANTSVNAIVREAGGSLATLYAEFGSKESLFESVLSERAARFFPEESATPKQPLDAEAEL